MTKLKTFMVVLGAQLVMVNVAMAATGTITDVKGLIGFVCQLVGYFFWFIMSLSALMILYAAYTYVTAGDDTEKTSKARKIITYAAVGVAVALLATVFPQLVNSIFSTPASGISSNC